LTGLDWSALKIKTKIVSCHTADSKPVKQEVNGTVILFPLVFPGLSYNDGETSEVNVGIGGLDGAVERVLLVGHNLLEKMF
jgi:hypothetical protein